jgi:cupin fold WbuC family metalloprotein
LILTHKESDEVYYPDEDIVRVDVATLEELKKLALLNERQRVRLCAHKNPVEKLHEMFIVHTSECYVRPHKHIDKAESMAILEGEVDLVLFHDDGTIKQVLRMGGPDTGKPFYYRISEPIYHALLIRSPFLVFHEVTEGPFLREKTAFPEWAPEENSSEQEAFLEKIETLIIKM